MTQKLEGRARKGDAPRRVLGAGKLPGHSKITGSAQRPNPTGRMTEPVIIATIHKSNRERVRVALTTWSGLVLADIRICFPITEATGVLTPTAKGVSLPIAMLPELAAAVVDAEATARRMGLIGEGAQ